MSGRICIDELRCDGCGSDAVVAIAPGSEEQRDMFLLVREVPMRCMCLDCWRVGREAA